MNFNNRRNFIKSGLIFVPTIFIPKIMSGANYPPPGGRAGGSSPPSLSCLAWSGQEMMTSNDFSTLVSGTTTSQKVKGISGSDVTVCKLQVVIQSDSTGSVRFSLRSLQNEGGTDYSGQSDLVSVSGASATYDVTWPANFTLPASTDFFVTAIKATVAGSVKWRENDGIFLYQDNTYTIYDGASSYAGQQTFKLFIMQ